VEREYFGTGFFVARHPPAATRREDNEIVRPSDGLALTACHNFEDCRPGQVFEADYRGAKIHVKWIESQSSKKADIAVMQLERKPGSVVVEGLRVGYLNPRLKLAERRQFFRERATVSLFGYPERGPGGVGWRIDGGVDSAQPIIDIVEAGRTLELYFAGVLPALRETSVEEHIADCA
jgi:hypothetical protein